MKIVRPKHSIDIMENQIDELSPRLLVVNNFQFPDFDNLDELAKSFYVLHFIMQNLQEYHWLEFMQPINSKSDICIPNELLCIF